MISKPDSWSQVLRESTIFLGSIALLLIGGITLYLIGIPLGIYLACVACLLAGFGFCLWLFRYEIFYWMDEAEQIEETIEPVEPAIGYDCPHDTMIRMFRVPVAYEVYEYGLRRWDGSDSPPERMGMNYTAALKAVHDRWMEGDRQYTCDLVFRPRAGVKR